MAKLRKLVRTEAQIVLVIATLLLLKQDKLYKRIYWKGLEVNN